MSLDTPHENQVRDIGSPCMQAPQTFQSHKRIRQTTYQASSRRINRFPLLRRATDSLFPISYFVDRIGSLLLRFLYAEAGSTSAGVATRQPFPFPYSSTLLQPRMRICGPPVNQSTIQRPLAFSLRRLLPTPSILTVPALGDLILWTRGQQKRETRKSITQSVEKESSDRKSSFFCFCSKCSTAATTHSLLLLRVLLLRCVPAHRCEIYI